MKCFQREMKLIESLRDFNKKLDYEHHYFYKEEIHIKMYSSSIVITDLKNAMKRGKEVNIYSITGSEYTDDFTKVLNNYLDKYKLDLFQFTKNALAGDLEEDLNVNISFKKGVSVFNPFYKPKEIKDVEKIEKWNISKVIKGILTGQIYKGECEENLTDDYYLDYLNDCGRGSIDLLELCKELVEEPMGWWINEKENNSLGVNCYSFNYNSVYINQNSTRTVEFDEYIDYTKVIDLQKYKIRKGA